MIPDGIKTFLYADDTALVSSSDSVEKASISLGLAQEVAGAWFNDHKLSLNVGKTKRMTLGTNQKVPRDLMVPPVSLNRVVVESVTMFKYLGILLDRHLTFD